MRARHVLSLSLVLTVASALLVAMVTGGGRDGGPVRAAEQPARVAERAERPVVAGPAPSAARAPRVTDVEPPPAADENLEETEPAVGELAPDAMLAVRVVARRERTRGGRGNQAPGIAGVEIGVGLANPYAPDSPVLAAGTTDASGQVELEIPWSAAEAARAENERLWARPTGAGWMMQTAFSALPRGDDSGPVELEVVALAGVSVRGRVVDREGAPLRAMVDAILIGTETRSYAQEGNDGWFLLHIEQPGTYELFARPANFMNPVGARYLGTGRESLEVTLEVTPPDLELRLQGEGILRGRVQGLDGKPVAGLDLFAAEASLKRSGELDSRLDDRLAREGLGGVVAWVTTDDEGHFELTGLRSGRYEISAGERRLTTSPVDSDGSELVLDAPRLVVQVVDEQGEPWTGQLSEARSFRGEVPQGWPDDPGVLVAAASTAADDWRSTDPAPPLMGQPLGLATVAFEVEPGRDYRVGLWGGAAAWAPRLVSIPPSGGRVEVTLAVPEPTELAAISLSVTDARGALTEGIAIRLEELDTGRPVLIKESFYRESWPLSLRVPPGDWRLAVEGHHSLDPFHGTVLRRRTHGRFELDLTLRAGETVPVEAHVPTGARLDLELAGEVEPADRKALVERWGEQREEMLAIWSARAEVRLLAPGRWPREVPFTYELTGSSAAGTHLASFLALGTRQVSEPVPAGRWRLEARMPGGRVASRELTLVDGETAVVRLEL